MSVFAILLAIKLLSTSQLIDERFNIYFYS